MLSSGVGMLGLGVRMTGLRKGLTIGEFLLNKRSNLLLIILSDRNIAISMIFAQQLARCSFSILT